MTPAMTPAMAPATTPATASWCISHSLAQPLNVTSEHFGSL